MKNLETYILKAIENIEDDRDVTKELLDDVIRYIGKDEEHHKHVGAVAAKYVETLQRSNEQLVKISTLIYKKQSSSSGLSDIDKEEIFDLLQDNENNETS